MGSPVKQFIEEGCDFFSKMEGFLGFLGALCLIILFMGLYHLCSACKKSKEDIEADKHTKVDKEIEQIKEKIARINEETMQYESQLNETSLYKSSNELTYAENPNITYQSISSHLYETLPRKNPSMTYLTRGEIPRKSTSKMRLSCDLSDLRD